MYYVTHLLLIYSDTLSLLSAFSLKLRHETQVPKYILPGIQTLCYSERNVTIGLQSHCQSCKIATLLNIYLTIVLPLFLCTFVSMTQN